MAIMGRSMTTGRGGTEAVAKSLFLNPQAGSIERAQDNWEWHELETSELTLSDIPLPRRPYLIFSQQFHQLGGKHSYILAWKGNSHPNQHSLLPGPHRPMAVS